MSKETERVALMSSFKEVFATLGITDIAWPNKPFETPANRIFFVFSIVDRGTTRQSLGMSQWFNRHHGTVQVDIYTPQDQGTKDSRQFADLMQIYYDSLELVTSDGESIKFQTPSSRALATNEVRAANLDDNWDRYVFEAPFYRDVLVEK